MPDVRTELDVGRAMIAGDLASPQRYGDALWLFRLRITGTKEAERRKHNEIVFRDPRVFLTDEFLERCQGLPVIIGHPPSGVLDSHEFRARVVGSIMLPYIDPDADEVWGIAKIHDAEAAEAMQKLPLSTSPAVVLRKDETKTIDLKDGKHLLIEGVPFLLDHLAIVESGVWDKGDGPNGIQVTERNVSMSDETAGSKGTELDGMLSKLDSTMTKMSDALDGLDRRLKAIEGERDRDDRRGRRDEEAGREPGKARPVVADCLDSDEKNDPAFHHKAADAQARADNAFAAFGERAPAPLQGESLWAYRRRLLRPHQKHSPRYKGAILETITDPAIMKEVEAAIYADSITAATDPENIAEGCLRMVSKRTDAGHTENRFYGHPSAWMNNFIPTRRAVTRINPKPEPRFV
jgi:hypothetical protein